MLLHPGERLGPYEILAPIGAGGMGDVYKARDTRLDRIVAIKVSKTEFSERFEREARAVAALNHSNICTLHDVGPNYLVMEYIEGTPLKGPLPVDRALKYAVQICAALDAAHNKGITHRDLKPANILATRSGIKLLDFGLAKLGTAGTAHAAEAPGDATLTMVLTGQHQIVGTLYYMSPEQLQSQANGQEIDARSDIFSFGLVLYEMLTGKRAFEGPSPASVIAAIMERPAPSIADVAPPALDRVLKTCLAKDPDDRWQTARDLKRELEWIANSPSEAPTVRAKVTRHRVLPWIAAVATFAIGAGGGWWWHTSPSADNQLLRLEIQPPEGEKFASDALRNGMALSPDGAKLAYVASGKDGINRLWIRTLKEPSVRQLPGTEDGQSPFWSPDGRTVAFFNGRKLMRIDVEGSGLQPVTDATTPRGGAWLVDGRIVFGSYTFGLRIVSAAGGKAEPLTQLTPGGGHRWPQVLPGGRLMYFVVQSSRQEDNAAYIISLNKPEAPTRMMNVPQSPVYVPGTGETDYLLWQRGTALVGQALDRETLQLAGRSQRSPTQSAQAPRRDRSTSQHRSRVPWSTAELRG